MAKSSGGSLPRGRRRRDEVPPIPRTEVLTPVQRRAQTTLADLVERVGGRFDSAQRIPVEHLPIFEALFDEWAEVHGESTERGIHFAGRPGLWHALDELYPLQDPNRWDPLRQATIASLEKSHWTRRSHPRGSGFDIVVR